ncbi:MAG: 30S ribosomal protein S6 [Chitinophagales bacterium]|nr:30S ribosomal protein S6 [Chitinophagales bacterium]HAE35243.1 30S ribosomal protein S6 [Bacteroidota bacterium]MCB9019346.1 30S ribosomal protein S6 [Chitinophagales bacterium]MCB9020596.1 30S ribosomal protein S6 [Chitinophagales bacterium]MCB9031452.1 30S ribosomal protein S6 [Chitinophagales bacterium]
MNQYETVVVLTPVLSDDDVKRTLEGYKELLKNNGAEMVHEELWGLKQLAYPIKKKTTGIYFVMEYKASGEAVAKMEVQFNRDEQVLRYLTIRLDKFSVDYNERKRRGEIGKNRKPAEATENA